jgi:hypothetical protein
MFKGFSDFSFQPFIADVGAFWLQGDYYYGMFPHFSIPNAMLFVTVNNTSGAGISLRIKNHDN